jgi:hypothetical protein
VQQGITSSITSSNHITSSITSSNANGTSVPSSSIASNRTISSHSNGRINDIVNRTMNGAVHGAVNGTVDGSSTSSSSSTCGGSINSGSIHSGMSSMSAGGVSLGGSSAGARSRKAGSDGRSDSHSSTNQMGMAVAGDNNNNNMKISTGDSTGDRGTGDTKSNLRDTYEVKAHRVCFNDIEVKANGVRANAANAKNPAGELKRMIPTLMTIPAIRYREKKKKKKDSKDSTHHSNRGYRAAASDEEIRHTMAKSRRKKTNPIGIEIAPPMPKSLSPTLNGTLNVLNVAPPMPKNSPKNSMAMLSATTNGKLKPSITEMIRN